MSGAETPERRLRVKRRGATRAGADITHTRGLHLSDYIYLFRTTAEARRAAMGTPELAQKSMQRWLAWLGDLETKGHLKNRGQPLENEGKLVRGKNKVITDGPFAEVKDLVAGFMIVEARDISQAAELAKGCPILEGDGAVEVRPVMAMNF